MKPTRRSRLIRILYYLAFLALLAGGVYCVAVYAPAVRESGMLQPAGEHVVPQPDDGETVYITAEQQLRLNLYGALFAVTLLTWLLLGLVLEMRLGIQVFRPILRALPPNRRHGPQSPFSPN